MQMIMHGDMELFSGVFHVRRARLGVQIETTKS